MKSLGTVLTSISINFSRHRHRLLTSKAMEETMAESKCGVIVPKSEDPSEAVVVCGMNKGLLNGLNVMISKANLVSRTRDLIDQIKQITIEIRDIKERKKNKIELALVSSTINVHNHTWNGPLQEGHVEHDEGDVHYEDNIQSVPQLPRSRNNRTRYVPTQSLLAKGSTSSQSPHPRDHPSLPSNGSPSTLTSKTPPWSTSPNDPESPVIEGGNVAEDKETDPPWKTTVNSSSCVGFGDDPDAESLGARGDVLTQYIASTLQALGLKN